MVGTEEGYYAEVQGLAESVCGLLFCLMYVREGGTEEGRLVGREDRLIE